MYFRITAPMRHWQWGRFLLIVNKRNDCFILSSTHFWEHPNSLSCRELLHKHISILSILPKENALIVLSRKAIEIEYEQKTSETCFVFSEELIKNTQSITYASRTDR